MNPPPPHPQKNGVGARVQDQKRQLSVFDTIITDAQEVSANPNIVSARVENVNFPNAALCDTGAGTSFISKGTYFLLPRTVRDTLNQFEPPTFTDATGRTHSSLGTLTLTLTVYGRDTQSMPNPPSRTITTSFTVTPTLAYSVIIGRDALPRLFKCLNFNTNKYELLTSTSEQQDSVKDEIPLILAKGINMGPYSSKVIQVTVPEHCMVGKPLFNQFLGEAVQVETTKGTKVPVRHVTFLGELESQLLYEVEIENASSKSISLAKNTRVGRAIPYDGEVISYNGKSPVDAALAVAKHFPSSTQMGEVIRSNP